MQKLVYFVLYGRDPITQRAARKMRNILTEPPEISFRDSQRHSVREVVSIAWEGGMQGGIQKGLPAGWRTKIYHSSASSVKFKITIKDGTWRELLLRPGGISIGTAVTDAHIGGTVKTHAQ